MAIAPTGAIYKSLIFDGEDSRDYGVYITGEAVFNAPEREVEMISIPGRNGAFALDKGRFNNIEVTYPAGIFADTEEDFAEAISEFRNFLCSRNGYVRLQDEYNPNEYRMAVYKSGLEVDPAMLKAGQFNIVFDCKPQRFLTSGETAIAITSGDTLTNPTLFEASPLLEVEGYGDVNFSSGYTINITDELVGNIVLIPASAYEYGEYDKSYEEKGRLVDYGDTLTLANFKASLFVLTDVYKKIESISVTRATTNIPNYIDFTSGRSTDKLVRVTIEFGAQTFTKLSDSSSVAKIDKFTMTTVVTKNDNTQETLTSTFWLEVQNSNGTSKLRIRFYGESMATGLVRSSSYFNVGAFIADSTQSVRGNPVYVDCDLGEAYKLVDGVPASLNKYIDLGSRLPTLAVGNTDITFDNTITDLQIVPRWWKI